MARMSSGVSLVELIVSLTIFLLAFVFIIGLLPASTLSQKRAESSAFAGRICQDELEKRMAQQSLAAGPLPGVTVEHENLSYRIEGAVTPEMGQSGTPLPGLFRVRVSATWREGGRQHEVLRETLVRREQ